ncbi:hypothetical protein N0V93_000746 [Gnomoniopsis smithogilvyi]|uniref:Uncharacterized protein n=1 Tax=Gnomoniopsis smithogilvyi TaxID=1191159 RepID=A0A9W8Z283_9PEZI|nr:hypothetical protein N0V93_000746 [Gnomoniopsis smithogilvyi]
MAFEVFWREAKLDQRGKRPNPRYLNIDPQGTLLREAQDIDEELSMMIRIYSQQLSAVKELRKSLNRWDKQMIQDSADRNYSILSKGIPSLVSSMDLDLIEEIMEKIKTRKAEIEELASAADRSCRELQGLLALKQQQASIVEAKMSHRLGTQSYEQGKSIMAFTIMTIVFTPLGFFTSFFGMDNSSTGQTWMSLWEQTITMRKSSLSKQVRVGQFLFHSADLRLVVGISAVIIAIFLAIAFRRNFRHPLQAAKRLRADGATQASTSDLAATIGISRFKLQSLKIPSIRPSKGSLRQWHLPR